MGSQEKQVKAISQSINLKLLYCKMLAMYTLWKPGVDLGEGRGGGGAMVHAPKMLQFEK